MCSQPTGDHRQLPGRGWRALGRLAACPRPQLLRPAPQHAPEDPAGGFRRAAAARDRADPGRLLPAPRQEAEAVPDHRAERGRGRRRHGDDVHLRPGPVRRHAGRDRRRAAADPLRDLHLEGRRGRRAVQARAGRGGRPGRRRLRHLRRASRTWWSRPAVQAVPAEHQGAALPRLHRRAAVLRPAPLRPRPPQDPRGRRRGRLRRRLQHRHAVRDRVARHALPDHRSRRLGPQAGVRRLLEPAPAQAVPGQRAAAAARDRLAVGAAASGCTATCRGCGCSRSGRCTSRRSTAPPATSG